MTLTQEIVKELLHYDSETGVLTWKSRDRKWFKSDESCGSWNTRCANKIAGTEKKCSSKSYKIIKILNNIHYTHRVIFLYIVGEMPVDQVDHIDGNGLNNRWNNLREVSSQENNMNMRLSSNNTSGVTGVCWATRDKRWIANIKVNRKNKCLGYFTDFNEAVAARKAAEIEHGFHCNHGSNRPL